MEKEIGSVLSSKYWREQFASFINLWVWRYKNYINGKNGRWLMFLVLAIWTPFAILLMPINFLLNTLAGYYKQKRFNETLTIIKYRDNKGLISEKIQEVLDKPRKRCVQRGKNVPFVCAAEAIVWELYQRGFYAEMLPILEELDSIFCKDRHLPKCYKFRLLFVESCCQCGQLERAKAVLGEIVDEIKSKLPIKIIDCEFSTLCKTVFAVKERVDDPSFIAEICHSLTEIKERCHYEDNQYFIKLL